MRQSERVFRRIAALAVGALVLGACAGAGQDGGEGGSGGSATGGTPGTGGLNATGGSTGGSPATGGGSGGQVIDRHRWQRRGGGAGGGRAHAPARRARRALRRRRRDLRRPAASRAAAGSPAVPKKFCGNITQRGQIPSTYNQYWDQITPENEGKWGSVEGTQGKYNWTALDNIHTYAMQHNMPFKQHNFVWGAQQPGWIGGLSQADQKAAVEDWIKQFCTRYPDTQMIDVLNEPPPHTTPPYMAALGRRRGQRLRLGGHDLQVGAPVLPELDPDRERLQHHRAVGRQQPHDRPGHQGHEGRRADRCHWRAGARPAPTRPPAPRRCTSTS